METLLKVEGINVYYGAIHAIKDISFQVNQGEIVTLIGANGAGKTTTLQTVSGLLRSKTGSILFDGQDINTVSADKLVGRGLAQVPEGRRVFLQMSVEENLEMGAYTQPPAGVPRDLEMVYDLFPRLKERRSQVAGTLSGGEQQMLAMGRALMSHPKLLMLDEPSMGLAPILVEQIFDIIQDLNRKGSTILLVEQNAQMALSVAHRGYVMETGKIVATGSGAELIESRRSSAPTWAADGGSRPKKRASRLVRQQKTLPETAMSAVSGNVFFCLGSAFGLLSQEGAHGLQAVHQGLPVAGVAHPDAVLLLEAVAWGDEGPGGVIHLLAEIIGGDVQVVVHQGSGPGLGLDIGDVGLPLDPVVQNGQILPYDAPIAGQQLVSVLQGQGGHRLVQHPAADQVVVPVDEAALQHLGIPGGDPAQPDPGQGEHLGHTADADALLIQVHNGGAVALLLGEVAVHLVTQDIGPVAAGDGDDLLQHLLGHEGAGGVVGVVQADELDASRASSSRRARSGRKPLSGDRGSSSTWAPRESGMEYSC